MDDLKLALRGFRKTPGVTAVIVLALALGIGVNASLFIFVSAIMLHPFPYPRLDRVMTLWEAPSSHPGQRGGLAPATYLDLQQRNTSFETLGAYRRWDANLSGAGEPERVLAAEVTPEFFAALGLQPLVGRILTSEETGAIVIGRSLWVARFASMPSAIGQKVSLNGASYTIVGVMPDEFNFPLETQVWAPLTLTAAERHNRESHSVSIIGRLKAGVPVTGAKAEMATLGSRLASEHPDTNENRTLETVPLVELVETYTNRFMLILAATAAFVLLLACANVANLFLVRLAARQHELAIRATLGASRGRIAMQLLMESALVSLIAGACGLDFAAWSLAAWKARIPAFVFRMVGGLKQAHIDSSVVLMTLALSLLAGILCAAPSLWMVLRKGVSARLAESLKESGRTGSGGRVRSRARTALAVSEVALALILLVCAGAMVQTFERFMHVNPGFDATDMLTADVALPPAKYSTPAQVTSFYDRMLATLGSNAAIESASRADALFIEGRPAPRPGDTVPAADAVSARYFETLRLPVIEGRAIQASDDHGHPGVVVLTKMVAKQYWPQGSAIGQHIRLSKDDPRWLTVVGVCGDLNDWFTGNPIPRAFVSFAQSPSANARFYLRTPGDPLRGIQQIRNAVNGIDPALAVFDAKTLERRMEEETSGVRSAATQMTTYALIGLFLAATGIYAVIAYSVVRRTHEIGIRMALGANRVTVLRMTLSEALRIGAIGLAIGLPVAYGLIRAMSSLLFGVVQLETTTFTGLTLTLALCAAAAGFIPAWRSSRLDPVAALRNE
jgi:putative ABC transport system permease protein